MLFRQKELLRWLGVTVFETWFFLLCLTIFTVLLVLKVDGSLLSGKADAFFKGRLKYKKQKPFSLHLLVLGLLSAVRE